METLEKIKNFRNLRVWQSGMDLVQSAYSLSDDFPESEKYALSAQLRRCAVSVPSNIAEGHTREHRKEYLQHLSFVQASLAELETQIEIAKRLRYVTSGDAEAVLSQIESLARQICALRNALKRNVRNAVSFSHSFPPNPQSPPPTPCPPSQVP